MSRLCVLGSLNMDLVARVHELPRPGETLHALSQHKYPGGKGANQAVAAARLGAGVAMIGRIGEDVAGSTLRRQLVREKVDVSNVTTAPNVETGYAMIAVADSGENTIIVTPGANGRLEPKEFAPKRPKATRIANADTLLVQLETPLPAVMEAVLRARENKTRVILNASPATELPSRLIENVDLLVVNRIEAAAITGLPADSEALGLVYAVGECGAASTVLTLGGDGAVSLESGLVHAQDAFPVEVIDTVGAGDAFVAGLAVGLDEGLPLASAMRLAAAAGALAATRAGAQPSFPSREEVDQLLG